MPSYNLADNFPVENFYSERAKAPLPTSFAGAIGNPYNAFPTQGYHFGAAAQPAYCAPPPLDPNYGHHHHSQHVGYEVNRTYSPSRYEQPSPHSASYGFPGAPQSMTPQYGAPGPAPLARRNSVVDSPSRARPALSDYSSLSGALDASVGPARVRSNSIQKHGLTSPYKTARPSHGVPSPSKPRRGSRHIGPMLPDGPADHLRVPQEAYEEPVTELGYQYIDHHRLRPVVFKRAGAAAPGIHLADVDGEVCPALEGAADRMFASGGFPYREFKIRVLWPGYPPFERRCKTQDGRRSLLLVMAAGAVIQSMDAVAGKLAPKRGFEAWTLGRQGIRTEDLLITGIEHRGGANWQVEIYVPKRKMGIP
ncbi:hypothetical protein B0H15DRAFT_808092 [Mycena belliarum]|uniref:Uncharacterized protein n=1 Tax=Mycena belliarum TaxID=1033014 RepID=A0AAD6UMS2_9AGAR|nr:hypothetical protein B0H15DRAFT_808092 [Mycena belliae]